MQRIISNFITPPAQSNTANNDMPWLFVTAARGLATFAGILSILLGAINSLTSVIDPSCFIAGLIMMCEGLVLIMIEAPCLCVFFDFAFLPNRLLEGRSLWIKATIYLGFAILPLSFCKSASLITSCFFVFITSALYLVLALGKKASAEEMRAKAVNENPSAVLVSNEFLPATSTPNQPFYKQTDFKNTNFTAPPQLTTKNDSIVY